MRKYSPYYFERLVYWSGLTLGSLGWVAAFIPFVGPLFAVPMIAIGYPAMWFGMWRMKSLSQDWRTVIEKNACPRCGGPTAEARIEFRRHYACDACGLAYRFKKQDKLVYGNARMYRKVKSFLEQQDQAVPDTRMPQEF